MKLNQLDIEGCDPLSLPVAALMYQQANNHWLRKLAHGRELYLIPTGDIAAVVFTTELLTQLRSRGIDLDRVSNYRARQDGKVLGKTANMLPNRSLKSFRAGFLLGPRIRNRNMRSLQLRNHLAQLRQQLGGENPETPNPPRSNQTGASPADSPIARALLQRKPASENLHRSNMFSSKKTHVLFVQELI